MAAVWNLLAVGVLATAGMVYMNGRNDSMRATAGVKPPTAHKASGSPCLRMVDDNYDPSILWSPPRVQTR